MQFLTKSIAVACLVAAGHAAPALQSFGPCAEPTLEIGAPYPQLGNGLLQATAESSFSIDVAGVGQATGAAFTVPAFSQANVSIALAVPALTSEQVRNLRDAWFAILDASQQESLLEFERQDTSASRNLGFFGWFSGGKRTSSSTSVRRNMESRGLNDEQIDALIDTFATIASAMSSVELQFTIYNQNNPFSVSGNVLVFVMSGEIISSDSQDQFRVISDGGQATGNQGNANAGGEIIPLFL